MRITGGKFRGHRFTPPADKWPTRPTTDFSKEAMYNILTNRIDFEEVRFLDLFGGTGNHCYENISRGAISATYVDKFGPAVAFVKKMAAKLEIEDQMIIMKVDVFKYIKTTSDSYNLIFAGPPYPLKNIPDISRIIMSGSLLEPGGTLIVEHNPRENLEKQAGFVEMRKYGQTIFSFFQH